MEAKLWENGELRPRGTIYLSLYLHILSDALADILRQVRAVEQDKVENYLKRNDKSRIVQGIKDDRSK